jgi:hypothetical protein
MSMKLTGAAAALLAVAAPTATAPVAANQAQSDKPERADSGEGKAGASKEKNEPFNPAELFAIFDKMFPAHPDPAPERLALSRVAVQGLLPSGAYARAMEDMIGSLVDRVLDMSEADFPGKAKDSKAPSTETMRQKLVKEDPHFEERMRIIRKIASEEMLKISALVEPRIREGLARSMARRFDEKQLADLNAFLATPSGKAYGEQSMAMWMDSDVMRGVFNSMPELIVAVPAAMKRIETETAHLPKPKKNEEEEDSEEDSGEASEEEAGE